MDGSQARHYAYRMDHDLGFAPHLNRSVCTLCGCKMTTVERWASPGSWVVGIGGNGTGKPNKLIYAMRIDRAYAFSEFRRTHPRASVYLEGRGIPLDVPVLTSRHYYYFGDQAIRLPPALARLVVHTQGCRRLSDRDVHLLDHYLSARYEVGRHGYPNGPHPGLPPSRRARCTGICR